jgi:predicted nucleic acid-binding protein
MILVDTGALYALTDKNDKNHRQAKKFYSSIVGQEILAISLPVLTESWLLLEARLGFGFVDATCFALCEKHKIRKVFTYDRKHFSLYRPRFASHLELLPP